GFIYNKIPTKRKNSGTWVSRLLFHVVFESAPALAAAPARTFLLAAAIAVVTLAAASSLVAAAFPERLFAAGWFAAAAVSTFSCQWCFEGELDAVIRFTEKEFIQQCCNHFFRSIFFKQTPGDILCMLTVILGYPELDLFEYLFLSRFLDFLFVRRS